MFPYLKLLNYTVPSYALMILFGLVISNILAIIQIKKSSLNMNVFLILEAYSVLGAMVGSKILYLWINRESIQWQDFFTLRYFNQLMRGGFVFYGGLIGGISFAFLAEKIHKLNLRTYLYEFIYLIPFVHGLGRIGCFLAGCCYGKEYDGIFHVVFPKDSFAPAGISLFPVQLVESICLFLLSLILFTTKKRKILNPIYLYFFGYSILRFILEFFRADDRGQIWIFSTSQWISLSITIGFAIYFLIKRSINVVREC